MHTDSAGRYLSHALCVLLPSRANGQRQKQSVADDKFAINECMANTVSIKVKDVEFKVNNININLNPTLNKALT